MNDFRKVHSHFIASNLRTCPKKSAQSFDKSVIERENSRRLVIYRFSNGFYHWNTLVRIPTSEVFGQVLSSIL
ncbi:hypothetical protein GS516_01880 [Leptospira borgpetersenii]|nr:hypothetical protein GS516_01880 [Leptospira borgpetersenii]